MVIQKNGYTPVRLLPKIPEQKTSKLTYRKMVDISIVVCTYSRVDMLGQALESLLIQETRDQFDFEIVVIDNASADGTQDAIEKFQQSPAIPIRFASQDGKGIGDARNKGVEVAAGKWIVFFDDDQKAEQDWLFHLFDFAHKNNVSCVGGPRSLQISDEILLQLGPIARGLLGENTFQETPSKCTDSYIPTCGNLMIEKSVFEKVGMFDTTMYFGGEDSDIVERIRDAGYEVWTTPNALVHHIIQPYRVNTSYLCWVATRWGAQRAEMDQKSKGKLGMLFLCVARIGQAALIFLPSYFMSRAKKNEQATQDAKYLLYRAEAHIRMFLHLFSPKRFVQDSYFAKIRFDNARFWSDNLKTRSFVSSNP